MSDASYIIPKDPHELFDAWLRGEEVQFRAGAGFSPHETWVDASRWGFLYYPDQAYRIKVDPYKKFKDALAAGERVDRRLRDGSWLELLPRFDAWKDYKPEDFRIALPWQDERDAQARGETVQFRPASSLVWMDGQDWLFNTNSQYRIKPKNIEVEVTQIQLQGFGAPTQLAAEPAPFNMPRIRLDLSVAGGKVTNVQLKEWQA